MFFCADGDTEREFFHTVNDLRTANEVGDLFDVLEEGGGKFVNEGRHGKTRLGKILTVGFVSVSPKNGFVRETKIAQKVGSGFN